MTNTSDDFLRFLESNTAQATPTSAPEIIPDVTAPTPAPRACTIPAADKITVGNAYYYDNGTAAKNRRYMMNLQLFDQTEPFTPDHSIAAWKGYAVLRHPSVFNNWLDEYRKEHQGKVSDALY